MKQESHIQLLIQRCASSTLLRFLAVGGVSTVFLVCTLYFLSEILHIWYIAASACAYTLTTIISFLLQKFWTFKNIVRSQIPKQFFLYVTLAVFNFFANIVLMYGMVEYLKLWYILSQIITLGCIATWDFILYRFIIFNTESKFVH